MFGVGRPQGLAARVAGDRGTGMEIVNPSMNMHEENRRWRDRRGAKNDEGQRRGFTLVIEDSEKELAIRGWDECCGGGSIVYVCVSGVLV